MQLARDAQSSGDPVAAESYLQHAEHYFRLIASAQQAQMGYARQPDDAESDEPDDDDVGAMPDRFASPPERTPAYAAPQPVPPPYQERQPYQGDRQPYNGERPAYGGERVPAQDRNGQDRGGQDRHSQDNRGGDRGNYDRQNRGDRPQRPQRPYREQENQNRSEGRQDYRNREPRAQEFQPNEARDASRDLARADHSIRDLPARDVNGRAEFTPRDVPVERQPEVARAPEPVRVPEALPAFITAPVRLTAPPMAGPVSEIAAPEPGFEPAGLPDDTAEGPPRFPVRRRRRTRAAIAADLAEAAGRALDAPGKE